MRIDALTGLRFVAALVVVVEHFHQIFPGLTVRQATQGGAGVSVFFVLSGFVMVLNYGGRFRVGYGDRAAVRRFATGRVARIVPLHLVALAVVAVLVLARRDPIGEHGPAGVAAGIVSNVFAVQAWLPAQVFNIWNGPSWSISAELFFYACFPGLVAVFVEPLRRRRWLGRAIVAVLVVETIFYLGAAFAIGDFLLGRGRDAAGVQIIVSRFGFFPAVRLGEFAAGCLLGAAYQSYRHDGTSAGWWGLLEHARWRTAMLVGAACVAAAIQWTPSCPASRCWPAATDARALVELRAFAVYLPIAVVAVAAVAWGASPVARVLASRPLVFLGEMSYALYITQWIVWLVINDPSFAEPTAAVAGAAIAAAFALAYVAHRFVERPARQRVLARQGR